MIYILLIHCLICWGKSALSIVLKEVNFVNLPTVEAIKICHYLAKLHQSTNREILPGIDR